MFVIPHKTDVHHTHHHKYFTFIERLGNVDHKSAIGENTAPGRRLGGFPYWYVGAFEPQNGSARRRMVERGYVCMYPSSRRFRCDLDTFPVCRVVNRVIREDTRKDAMYIDTA